MQALFDMIMYRIDNTDGNYQMVAVLVWPLFLQLILLQQLLKGSSSTTTRKSRSRTSTSSSKISRASCGPLDTTGRRGRSPSPSLPAPSSMSSSGGSLQRPTTG